MFKQLFEKFKESLFSVGPIAILVLLLISTICPMDAILIWKFVVASVLLILGMTLFTLGADSSMIPMGESIGTGLRKTKKLSIMLLCSLIIGFILTMAEPDLAVLASQVPSLNKWIFIIVVSLGVGIFLMLAMLKMVFRLKMSVMLAISFGLVFLLSFFVSPEFVPISFDSGSVTTGPISVPFLISFGLGLSAFRSSKKSEDDSFGFIALCSTGPILAIMILSLFLPHTDIASSTITFANSGNIFVDLWQGFAVYLKDVALILLPIVYIFLLFQFTILKLPKITVLKIMMGLVYTYIGVVLFLTGVNAGYLPMAFMLGSSLSASTYSWVLFPLSFIFGYFIIAAEPAVHVLKKQVEKVTGGTIKERTILISMSIGVALSVLLAMLRTYFDINIIFIILPIYLFAIILTFVNSTVFSAIAFDAGGTATGSMAVSFILPFLAGVSDGGSAFGTVAIIASMPILTLQIVGLFHTLALRRANRVSRRKLATVEIIDFR